jgi:predicted dehydrogenase
MKSLRVGVVGAGRMGERHCRIFSNLRRVQLVAICDVNSETGARVGKLFDVINYKHVEDIKDKVDAISIASPTQLHYEQVLYFLDHGIHVLVEKPIAENLDQAKQLVDASDKSGLVVQVGHIENFNPAYIELRNILDDKLPLAINFRRLSAYKGSNKDVDVVLDLMIHDTNLLNDLIKQEPKKLTAFGFCLFSGKIDHSSAQLLYQNGPIASLTASRITEQKVRSIEVTTPDAYINCDLLNKNISIHRSTVGEYFNNNQRGVKYHQESVVEWIYVPTFEPLFLQLQHFVDCIIEGKTPLVSARDGYKAMKLAVTIRDLIEQDMVEFSADKVLSG